MVLQGRRSLIPQLLHLSCFAGYHKKICPAVKAIISVWAIRRGSQAAKSAVLASTVQYGGHLCERHSLKQRAAEKEEKDEEERGKAEVEK